MNVLAVRAAAEGRMKLAYSRAYYCKEVQHEGTVVLIGRRYRNNHQIDSYCTSTL